MNQKLKYILLGGLIISTYTSCQRDKLDPVPETSITDASAFSTPIRITNQVLSLYGSLKNGSFYGGRAVVGGELKGEDFFAETTNLVTGFDVWNLNVANSATFVRSIWSQGYLTINRCNVFIDGMASTGTVVVGQSLANNYIGEARLIRALSYWTLLQYFARPYADGNGSKPGLPLRLTGIVGPGSSDQARATVGEVYNQIITDLDFAEANLPISYSTALNNTTRAHKNTAIALKTRVYLSMQRYSNVITEADKIVPTVAPFTATSGVAHTLQADITNVFKAPYTTTESIFSLPMSSTSGDNPGTQNQIGYYFYNNTGAGTGEYSLNPNGIAGDPQWGGNDKRRELVYTNTATNKRYLSKFATGSPYTDIVPIIRWSEVLLNLAEALARTNTTVNVRALALLNAVHGRSDATMVLAPTTQSGLVDVLLKERRIEFIGEGLRNSDLMRLLQTIPAKGSAPAKAQTEQGYIWPISSDELSLNKLMTDN
ncbi:MAG TPA: RagB/SusD family nutrient uptake outer membrane protein [Segetibacter sp.]